VIELVIRGHHFIAMGINRHQEQESYAMVVFQRTIGRVVRYRKVFLPTAEHLAELMSNSRWFDVLRVFSGPTVPPNGVLPIVRGCRQTTVVDLSKGQEAI
jgi:hypothetical protein